VAKVRLHPIGFWSYVRRDDERSRGKISELRELVLAALGTQIGGDVPVFKDTISIPHGVRWEELTTRALSDATFFIPILTPAFLQSEWCCKEVRLFLKREQELFATYPDLPRRSRIFPIHYVDVGEDADALDHSVRDTLMGLQQLPFHRKRNLNYGAPEVCDFIAAFVTDIRDLLRARVKQAEALPPPEPPAPPPPTWQAAPQPSAKETGPVVPNFRGDPAGGGGGIEERASPVRPWAGDEEGDARKLSQDKTFLWSFLLAIAALILVLAVGRCRGGDSYGAVNNIVAHDNGPTFVENEHLPANVGPEDFPADDEERAGNIANAYSDHDNGNRAPVATGNGP